MTEDNLSTHQKRNKPCENCRAHRRKCIHLNNSTCERCLKLNLECVYKVTEKPIRKVDKSIANLSKGKQMIEIVWQLEQQIKNLQIELYKYKQSSKLLPSNTLPETSNEHWALTIKSDNHGIQVQTTIQSIKDLSIFFKETLNLFVHSRSIQPECAFQQAPVGSHALTVYQNKGNAESLFRQFFKNKNKKKKKKNLPLSPQSEISSPQIDLIQPLSNLASTRQLKTQLVDIFFHCQHYSSPLFIYHYHYPLLISHPDSLLSTAIAAFVGYSPCVHTSFPHHSSLTRLEFAEQCRLETREMLEDHLFIPDVYTCVALYFLSLSSLSALKGSEARLQSSLCWSIINQLGQEKDVHAELELEVLKRLYHLERYLEFNMAMLYDGATDFSDKTFFQDIGVPAPMDTMDDEISVMCFQALTRLMTNASSQNKNIELIGLQLMAGVIDTIPSRDIQLLERSLLDLWDSLPKNIRLGEGPYIWMDSIDKCVHPSILRFNVSYYIYWMNFQSRVMQQPRKTDLTGAMLSRIDGDRAILIVSICSDAVAKLFLQLADVLPCAIELHWLSMSIDIVHLLSSSANRSIQRRAQDNLKILVRVLKQKLWSPDSDKQNSVEPPYQKKIKKLVSKYMTVNNICNL